MANQEQLDILKQGLKLGTTRARLERTGQCRPLGVGESVSSKYIKSKDLWLNIQENPFGNMVYRREA